MKRKRKSARTKKLEKREYMKKKREECKKDFRQSEIIRKQERQEALKEMRRNVMQLKRQDRAYRKNESLKNIKLMARLRKQAEYKEKEKLRNKEMMAILRQQKKFKENEKQRNKALMSQLRKQEEYREKEKQKDKETKSQLRQEEEYRERERQKNKEIMSQLRQEEEYRERERQKNKEIMSKLRKQEEYREKEKQKNKEIMSQLRKQEEYREKEKQKDKEIKSQLRQEEEYRERERLKNKEIMNQLRQEEEYRERERQKNKEIMSQLRKQEEYREKEKQKDKEIKSQLRQEEEYRERERLKNKEIMSQLRQQEEYREKERKRNKEIMKHLRSQEEYRKKEKFKDVHWKRDSREDEDYRVIEKQRDREAKRNKRQIDLIHFRDLVRNNLNRSDKMFDKKQLQFLEERKCTPSNVCCCCEGLFFNHSVVKFEKERFMSECQASFLCKVYNMESKYICKTCKKYVSKGVVPKLATSNGLKFIQIPECVKNLSPLEERMVSPYINFMQIRALKSFALNPQLGLKGSVVNIPIEINDILQVLPRTFDNMATIQVKLKRHMLHATDYMFETIRPAIVCEALKYLQTTPLYKKYEIEVDHSYFLRYDGKYEEKINFIVDPCDMHVDEELENANAPINNEETEEDKAIEEMECDEEVIVMDRNFPLDEDIKVTAPGQNKKPIPWHMVEDLDELTFPTIFGGHAFNIPPNVNITYSDRAKSECRRKDRRSCTPNRLLYMAKKKLEKSCLASINVCLRKTKFTEDISAAHLTNPEFIKNLISFDAGYNILSKVRSSPSYWESKKKELLAMIRQLGKPALFLTLSAGEKIWPELIKILYNLKYEKNISIEESYMLSEYEKTMLIRNDPVTCARYFDYKVTKFMNLIKQEDSFFGSYLVEDSYSRVEFQMRGSPHEHTFLWLKDAPFYEAGNQEAIKTCVEFIDDFITCEYDPNNPLISLQTHKHTSSCHKGTRNKGKCRFNFPIPIMPRTVILEPLTDEEKSTHLKESLNKIRQLMTSFYKNPQNISFADVLSQLQLTEEEYILSIRCSLKRTQVFLKRTSLEVAINCYNKSMLKLFESNMDIQFILEEYGLASYVINYISKVDAGLSKLLREAASDIKIGNNSIKEKFRNVANAFLNSNLMSAQEAAYHVLSLPLSKMSRQCIFINTSPSKERVFMLKSKKDLQNLPGDSTDVFLKDYIKKYSERPDQIEQICLADYCALYSKKIQEHDENEDNANEDNLKYNKRKKSAVIRYRRYKLTQDPLNYYREQIMLFLPWRMEENEVQNIDCEKKYYTNIEEIEKNRMKYSIVPDETIEAAMKTVMNEISESEEEDIYNFEADEISHEQQIDILEQGGIEDKKITSRYTSPKRISENEMAKYMQELNQEQRHFVLYTLHWMKTKKTPLRIFLSGSAGVGKSTVINCIYQLVTNFYDNMPGENKEKMVVLLCAPSGRAAFLIKGVTLHTAFALPVTQFSGNMPELSHDIANSIREKLSNLKLLIIDEISMVGSTLFHRIDTRLRQIKGVNSSFGGISVICVGDLNQLPPVMDSHIFKQRTQNEMSEFFDFSALWDEFHFYELNKVMRQKNDREFITALNNLAIGKMTEDDISLIKSRQVTENEVPQDAIRLFSENIQVEAFNNQKIDTFPGEEYIVEAKDKILGKINDKTKSTILNSLLTKKITETNGLPHRLRLKLGIRYMITCNVDVEDGLVNGACGLLKHITFKPNSQEARQLWFDFGPKEIGNKARMPFVHQMKTECIPNYLTPLVKSNVVLNLSNKLNFQVTRQQFPLTPAEALTIHKSQGQTCKNICVDFNKMKRVTRPLLYVALSRVTSISGLHILGNFRPPKSNESDKLILQELNRLKTNRSIPLQSEFETTTGLKVAYLNVNSLQTKMKNITIDEWYHHADVLIFSETLTKPGQEIRIPNYFQVLRSDACGLTRGLLVFAKRTDIILDQHIIDSEKDSHVELFSLKISNFTIVSGYKSPKFLNAKLKASLKKIFDRDFSSNINESKLIVMGDFNFDITHGNNSNLMLFFNSFGLYSQLPLDIATTNLNTQIDVIFSNVPSLKCGTHETYFSYHKSIYIIVDENNRNPETKEIQHIHEKSHQLKNVQIEKTYFEGARETAKNDTFIRNLTESEMAVLLDCEGYLEDSHMDLFAQIVNYHTHFQMQSVLYVQIPNQISPVPLNKPNLQILYSSCPGSSIGHWICTYYDGEVNHIYDSLNSKYLQEEHKIYLNMLYGNCVKNVFHEVQNQSNFYDCGVFAIAFAVTICFGKNPEHESYISEKMRLHAAKIFNTKSLLPFPTRSFKDNE